MKQALLSLVACVLVLSVATPALGQTVAPTSYSDCLADPSTTPEQCAQLLQTQLSSVNDNSSSVPAVVWVIIGVGVIIEGLVAKEIWTSKGGPELGGFLSGLVLGPLGLFYVAFAKPGKRNCPSCVNSVPDKASRCPTCGELLAPLT